MIKIEITTGEFKKDVFGWIDYFHIFDDNGTMFSDVACDLLDVMDEIGGWKNLPKGASLTRNNGELIADFGSLDFPVRATAVKIYDKIAHDIGHTEEALFGGMAFHVRGDWSREVGRKIAARRAVEELAETSMYFTGERIEKGGTLVYSFSDVEPPKPEEEESIPITFTV